MVRWWGWLAIGCGHPLSPRPMGEPFLPYHFEARTTAGEVRVVPALRLHDPLAPEIGSMLGPRLSDAQQRLRFVRAAQLNHLSAEVGLALPSEVNGQLGDRWMGQFRLVRYPLGVKRRLIDALRAGRDVDRVLGDAAQAIGGDASLVTWIDEVEAVPLTLLEWPGLVVETESGPVMVDAVDEPYVVKAAIGMALVAADGEVVLRYYDHYETVLSSTRGPKVAARELAFLVAREVSGVWVTDPRLYQVDSGLIEPRTDAVIRTRKVSRSNSPLH